MSLAGSAATISSLTLLSRITGLVRENITAVFFGATGFTDAFFVAFRLPNLLRRLFAEGAFSQAFVPILAETRAQAARLHPDDSAAADASVRLVVDRIATVLFWALIAVALLGILVAPAIVGVVAFGLREQPAVFDAAIVMTRWMFPYIVFISLISLSAGILNTWRHYAVPAFTPVLLNLAFIGSAIGLADRFDPPIYALAAGVVLGGIAQLALQVPALYRIGMLPRIGADLRSALADAHTRRVLTLMGPAALAVSVAQLSLLINTHIASRLAPGSVSWISYGDRLMEFPTALLGVALGTVLLPTLSRARAGNHTNEYRSLLDWGLRLCVVFSIPCMVGLATLAEPLTALLFHYGRFDAHDVAMTRQAVTGYSVGIVGLIAVKVLAPGYYASQDVRTPVRIALVVLVVTQLLNILTVPWLQHAGLTVSISLGALANAAMLLAGLHRRGLWRPSPGWARFLVQTGIASALLAVLLWYGAAQFDWIALRHAPGLRIALVLGFVAGGGLFYALVLLALGMRPKHLLRHSGERA